MQKANKDRTYFVDIISIKSINLQLEIGQFDILEILVKHLSTNIMDIYRNITDLFTTF